MRVQRSARLVALVASVGVGLLSASVVADAQPAMRKKAPGPTSMSGRFAHLPPSLPSIKEPINMQKLRSMAAVAKSCGIVEVAPNVFTRLDCQQYQRVSRAVPHYNPAKMRMLKQGKLSSHKLTLMAPALKTTRAGISLSKPGDKPQITPPPPPSGGDIKGSAGQADNGSFAAEDLPDAVDHRTLGLEGPIKDQGSVGSCTAFSLSSTIDNALRRAGKDEVISPTHVWAGYGMPNMEEAGNSNINRGLAVWDTWPHSQKETCRLARHPYEECDQYTGVPKNSWKSDPKLMASLTKSDQSGQVKIASLEELATSPVNIDELVQVLASGSDIWSAVRIDGNKWRNSAMTRDAVIPDWTMPTGGHAVVLSGYRNGPKGREFLVHNSWGTSWGVKGFAWVSEKMMKDHLKFAYRVKLDGENVKPVELTDDDCAWDELVDSQTGKCGKICPDDSRPQGGACPKG